VERWINNFLGGDVPTPDLGVWQVVTRCLIVYLAGLFVIRLGKSRLLSRSSPLDVILAFILGSLLSRGINGAAALSGTLVAVVTLVAIHAVLTWLASRYHWLGNAIKGQEYLLISNGEIVRENLLRSHISERDLIEELRLQANVESPAQVQTAYKERSGEVGVVKKPLPPHVLEIAVHDGVQIVKIEWSGRE
jgi:uncharacterized membrane protein YcaP (DUF421 family)